MDHINIEIKTLFLATYYTFRFRTELEWYCTTILDYKILKI